MLRLCWPHDEALNSLGKQGLFTGQVLVHLICHALMLGGVSRPAELHLPIHDS